MKSRLLGLRTAIYKVSDLAMAKAWYADAFGVAPYFDEAFYVGFNIRGYELGLHPADVPLKSDNVSTYWGVKDIQKEFDRFISMGASLHEAPQNVGGQIMIASVKDPWGNVIGLIYNPEFDPN